MHRRSSSSNHRFIPRSIDHQKCEIRRRKKRTTLAYLATGQSTIYFRQCISSRAVWYIDLQVFFTVTKRRKESQPQYEQRRKRSFQKKWISLNIAPVKTSTLLWGKTRNGQRNNLIVLRADQMMAVIKVELGRYYITNKNTYTIWIFVIKFHIRQCHCYVSNCPTAIWYQALYYLTPYWKCWL